MLAKSEAKSSSRTSSRAQNQQTSPSKSSKRPRIDDKATEAKIAKLRVAQSSVAGSQKDDPASPDNNITSSSTSSPEPNTQHNTRTTTRSNSLDSSNNDTPSQTQEDLPPPRRTSARRRVTVQPTTTSATPATNARESADSDNESENHVGSDEDDMHEEEVNSDKEVNKKSKPNKRTYTSEAMKQRFENLDQQQIQIREGSHPQYIQLLEDIESKRSEKYGNAEIRRKLAQGAITACYEADEKQANDQYYFGRVSIRREMLDQVQQKISALHTEYITLKFGQEYSLAKAKLFSNWVPPERPTMISSLTPGLQDDEIAQDMHFARNIIDYEQEEEDDDDEEEESEIDHEYEDEVLFPDPKENEVSENEQPLIESSEQHHHYRPSELYTVGRPPDSRYEPQLPDHKKPTFRYIPRPLAPLPPPSMAHHEHDPVPASNGMSPPHPHMASQRPPPIPSSPPDRMNGKNIVQRKPPVNIAPAWARPPPPPQPSGRIDFDLSGPDSPPLETLASLADEQYRQYYSKRSFIVQERIKDYTGSKKKKKKSHRHGKKAKRAHAEGKSSSSKDVLVS